MSKHMSLAQLTVIGATPPEMISIAAVTGYDGITISAGLTKIDCGGTIYSLLDEPSLRRETAKRMADTGITIDLIEGVGVSPTLDMDRLARVLDVMGDLGASRLLAALFDPEPQRAADMLAAQREMAEARGISLVLEFMGLAAHARSLGEAIKLVTDGRFKGLTILVDSLHLIRCGGSIDELKAVDPALIGFAQLCDGPLTSPSEAAYFEEAVFERQVPGKGELPLTEFVAAIPPGVFISPEVPMRKQRQLGVSLTDLARMALEGARRVCVQAEKGR